MKFSPLAEELLKKRYLLKEETPDGMFRRVAGFVAAAEVTGRVKQEEKFYNLISSLDFLPNSPCLMNAGTKVPQLAACFVYPIEDDMEAIFDTLKHTALTHKTGGGTGFSFSRLRPRGDIVKSTGGKTTGPISFMEVYDKATEAVMQGGKRRGANMGILRVDHPDIEEFIDAKADEQKLNNFNISVALTDEFMEALKNDSEYNLYYPPGKKVRGKKNAKFIFDKIARGGWKNGEPGVIFIDKVNRSNPLKEMGDIEATNPCGEQPLFPYEACILGSINLSRHVAGGKVDWKKLKGTTETAVEFLDDAIDVSFFPLKAISETVKSNRKIGLGIMGFAAMLMKLNISYNSVKAIELARKTMDFITKTAHRRSEGLAEEKGEFPNYFKSDIKTPRRNALVTTIAPTGSISILAGTTSGIEPLYSLVIDRESPSGKRMLSADPVFIERLKKEQFSPDKISSDEIIEQLSEGKKLSDLQGIPDKLKEVFVTALDIPPRVHVLMQAAFQKYVDNAISKTVNLPEHYGLDGVKDIIVRAYRTGCKGITVYRHNARRQQVLNIVCECDNPGLDN
ncbi:MAG: adenosylcobalamin-dependent ribonucleoside-diphosphate reductase [Elusimicrobia bacterium]|jgi:ribonucleoside-diphosphate reductase alpha chain|nr:adenosylcobalamin-dependent ribonucleoside-diphosphate reductase [Elusimicrobiota bacterium]